MQNGAHIGPSVIVKGHITAREPITIAGRVEGTIDVAGQIVTIEAGSQVHADITAAGIVVGGLIKGTLVAEDRIELRSSAEIEGDLTAPRVAVADGAVLRGRVDIAGSRKTVDLARAS
ncbi:MAG: polymer-forming cytoskeletal protein [Acidobacteria bacterium]|nr:polymer-forming cytoskeletal protein [Acidobacteriota bacterium]